MIQNSSPVRLYSDLTYSLMTRVTKGTTNLCNIHHAHGRSFKLSLLLFNLVHIQIVHIDATACQVNV